jgi:hypothetical protein
MVSKRKGNNYMKNRSYLVGVGILFCLTAAGMFLCQGCASVDPKLYASQTPVLDLSRYFNGPLEASGIFQNRKGEVVKRFHVKMVGTWSNNVGRLEEDFVYSDGTKQRRVWTLTKLDDHTYTGTADDVIGSAKGAAYGNALNWRYTLALPVDKTIYHVQFDDWMFLVDDTIMLNRAVMSKWGFRVGEVTLSFTKGTTVAR